jgi:riboflavin kinase/FMN adenylyltransferase
VERLLLLGVEYVFMLNFTEAISKLSYKEFFSIYLDKLLSVEGICIGKNFKFGKDARGDIKSLNELAVSHKILIKTVPLIQIDPLKNQDIEEEKKERVLSSTLIRESVALGKFEGIKEFLSCDYSLSGVIVEGLSHGKQIGFPTLNLALTYDALVPLDGIYLGYVQLSDSPKLEALIFVGEDLVFETNKRSIEAHIIDERFNIKEKLVYVNANFYFLKYMRDNKSFAFLQSLQKAIMEDVAIGKALFRNLSSSPP